MALEQHAADQLIKLRQVNRDNAFDILGAVGRQSALVDIDAAREQLLWVLDQRDSLPAGLSGLVDALLRQHGLYPYIQNIEDLSISDRIALEAHRPRGDLGRTHVFHTEQALAYEHLLAGENVILSAPTSFGKSLLIDAYLATGLVRNAAIIVPSIALMDECRRRLAQRSLPFKIITHSTQSLTDQNLFIMTQERLLEVRKLPPLDFFAIDEFYKLDPSYNDSRSSQLNIALDKLLRTGAQFYLLGPNISGIDRSISELLRARHIDTAFTTVATELELEHVAEPDMPRVLADICHEVGPGTIVFCKSPARVRQVANWLLERSTEVIPELTEAADWIGEAYHRDWIAGRALRFGIGMHHARIPRALAHHIVRLFNEGRLPFLLVTSTLIEGVNTSARNVIILDNTIGKNRYDHFTFMNIRGRAGRMFKHFVGKVIIFNPEPQGTDHKVDIPVVSQSPRATEESLLQLPVEELSPAARARIARYLDQDIVSVDTLRMNRNTPPARQMNVAETLAAEPDRWHNAMNWSSAFPRNDQIKSLSPLLFELTGRGSGIYSESHLSRMILKLRHHKGDLSAFAAESVGPDQDLDAAMDEAFGFARNWAQFKIPTAFAAAANLANDVFARTGRKVTNPAVFAGALENLFQDPFAMALEEFGLPLPTTRKLTSVLNLRSAGNLDEVLDRLRSVAPPPTLGPFEREMLEDAVASL